MGGQCVWLHTDVIVVYHWQLPMHVAAHLIISEHKCDQICVNVHSSHIPFLILKIHKICLTYQTDMKLTGIVMLFFFYHSTKFQILLFFLSFFMNL